MYTLDKIYKISLRLTERQFDFVRDRAIRLDVSPSDFIRMLLNSAIGEAEGGADEDKQKYLDRFV